MGSGAVDHVVDRPGAVMGNRRRSLLLQSSLERALTSRFLQGAVFGMPNVRQPIDDPATLNAVEEALDEVWESLASYLVKDGDEAARMRLANMVLDLAKDGQLGTLQITRTAARLMRETDKAS